MSFVHFVNRKHKKYRFKTRKQQHFIESFKVRIARGDAILRISDGALNFQQISEIVS